MTEKWGKIQGKFELAGEFELSEFELPGFFCNNLCFVSNGMYQPLNLLCLQKACIIPLHPLGSASVFVSRHVCVQGMTLF